MLRVAMISALAALAATGVWATQPAASPSSRIELEVDVAAPIAKVWQAWTTRDGLRSFFGEDNKVELRIGGPFEIYMSMQAPEGKRGSEGCAVLSYLPEEMLSFSWNAPPKFEHARARRTWVVVQLTAVGRDQTRVRVVHLGFDEQRAANPEHVAEWNEVEQYFRRAWPMVLDGLKSAVGS